MIIGIDIRSLMGRFYSGVPEYTFNLVKKIIEIDNDNEYKLFCNSLKEVNDEILKLETDKAQIIKKKYPNKILNYILFKIFNRPRVDSMIGADIFFMPNINFISLKNYSRSVITVHDLSFLRYPEFFGFKRNIWHKIVAIKKNIKRFGYVVAISENTKRDIIDLCGVDENKVTVIRSAVSDDFKRIKEGDNDYQGMQEVKLKYNLPEKFIFSLGTLEPRKNIEGLIESYGIARDSGLDDYKLVIAGGAGWKNKKIFKAHEQSKYKNDILFLGYVDRADKVYLYNLSSLFVFPSFYEGFGFPVLEAMTSGTPVVASFSSSIPEITGDSALLIDPYDNKKMALAIREVLSSNALSEKMVIDGLERAKHFSWEKTAIDYINLFKKVKGA